MGTFFRAFQELIEWLVRDEVKLIPRKNKKRVEDKYHNGFDKNVECNK